jgi:hypothetical protein
MFITKNAARLLRTSNAHMLSPNDALEIDGEVVRVSGFAGRRGHFNVWFVLPRVPA